MKLIAYQFWKMRRALNPRAQFKRVLWQRLASVWAQNQLPRLGWYQTAWFRFALAGLVGLVAVGSFGTGAYAYVSPAVTEGTILYPLKRALERAEEKLQRTPEQQAKFYLKQLERREAEAVVLEWRGESRREWLENQTVNLEERLGQVSERLENNVAKEAVRRAVRTRLERKQFKLERKLERLNKRPGRHQFKENNNQNQGQGSAFSTSAFSTSSSVEEMGVAEPINNRRPGRDDKIKPNAAAGRDQK